MNALSVYLYGPDVFHPDVAAEGERLKAVCAAKGLVSIFPLDARPSDDARQADDLDAGLRAVHRHGPWHHVVVQPLPLEMIYVPLRRNDSRHYLAWPIANEEAGMKVVDLFCSAGGLAYGLSQAGMRILASYDHDPGDWPYIAPISIPVSLAYRDAEPNVVRMSPIS